MGSGASKPSDKGASPVVVKGKGTTATRAGSTKGPRQPDEFDAACMVVFRNADQDQSGTLSRKEFWSVLQSKTLDLNLSNEEMEDMQRLADADGTGNIKYEDFVPLIRKLLQRVYQKKATDWNDWCLIVDPTTGKKKYLNKRTGKLQANQPENFNKARVEERSFEYITLDDGTEVTTYMTDDKVRMYMDWDSQEWKPFPDVWYPASHRATEMSLTGMNADAEEEEVDPRVGEYVHPRRGVFPTYLFENSRNTRLYFDEAMGQWARMPLSWERNVPEVKSMLDEIDKCLPQWRNVNEQLLVLRECNYELEDAIVFAEINWGFEQGQKDISPVQLERTMRASIVKRRASMVFTAIKDKQPDLGTLSVAASSYIHDLESKLAALQKEVSSQKSMQIEEAEGQLATLSREKTVLASRAKNEERALLEARQAVDELNETLAEVRKRTTELEKQVVALQAENEQLQAGAGVAAAAGKGKAGDVEKLRNENVALKLKVTQLKSELEVPTKSPAAMKIIGGLHTKVKALQTEKTAFDKTVKADLAALAAMFFDARRVAKDMGLAHTRALDDITQKYRAEALQRKLLYNKVQELRGNIRVFCRVRPDKDSVVRAAGDTEVVLPSLKGDDTIMEYDHVYGVRATQEEIFADTKPIILSCIDGYNVCLMAYGQTGSGKTYTMMGPPENPGVNRRAIRELLALAKERPEIEFEIKVSLMEVYNENLYDLLSRKREKLSIHQNADGVYVPDLTERVMSTQADIEAMLEEGSTNRSTESTKMNTESSRSHLLLQIYVTAHNTISKQTNFGKLTLVDLAGSERVSKSEASGDRLLEAAAINKSLTSLGQVFKAIQTHAPHIPYRNSKLTHVLQDSLGGDSKTALFINVRGESTNLSETHATLNFGQNIRKIELGPATKHKTAGPPPPPMKSGPKK